jgi:hypothetical protein
MWPYRSVTEQYGIFLTHLLYCIWPGMQGPEHATYSPTVFDNILPFPSREEKTNTQDVQYMYVHTTISYVPNFRYIQRIFNDKILFAYGPFN